MRRLYWSAYFSYHLHGQSRFPFLPLSKIHTLQNRRVQKMIRYAYTNVPYYRQTMDELGLRASDFETAEDLAKLPILERREMQEDPRRFVSKEQSIGDYLELASGGSTGEPISVYHDTAALFQNAAHGERERSILTAVIGKPWGYKETIISSPPTAAVKVRELVKNKALFPSRVRIERQYLSPHEKTEDNILAINVFQPDVIHAYGSYLEVLFPYIQSTGVPFHFPKVVTYSSDGLSPSVRNLITEVFGIPVFSTYQAIEAFKIGFECSEHCGLHLNIDLYPLRIVNSQGQNLPAGEQGEVVISNLINRGTVLLNYRLGDVASVLSEPCKCGRSLPLLTFPDGRSDDWIQHPSGEKLYSKFIRTIFAREPQIWQYQVVQKRDLSFEISIVASKACNQRETTERVRDEFLKSLGPTVETQISFVDSIPRTANGKVKPIISLNRT